MVDMSKYASRSFINLEHIRRHGPVEGVITEILIGKYDKLNLFLESGDVFSVNKQNSRTLVEAFGKDSDAAVGHRIRLEEGTLNDNQGQPCEAVVIVVLDLNENEEAEAKPKPEKHDDQIPF